MFNVELVDELLELLSDELEAVLAEELDAALDADALARALLRLNRLLTPDVLPAFAAFAETA
jgi:hypothetical protein